MTTPIEKPNFEPTSMTHVYGSLDTLPVGKQIARAAQAWEKVPTTPEARETVLSQGNHAKQLGNHLSKETGARALVLSFCSTPDERASTVLTFPFIWGGSAADLIKATFMAQALNPNGRTIVFPNNSRYEHNYDLSDEARNRMAQGDMLPLSELQMTTLEAINRRVPLGDISVIGNSQGGLTALGLGAIGSPEVTITDVVAVEPPSKRGRGPIGVGLDFMRSGGPKDLDIALEDAGIPILTSTRKDEKPLDFPLSAMKSQNRACIRAMAGSAEYLLNGANRQLNGRTSISHIEDSRIFDPNSINTDILNGSAHRAFYYGEGTAKHATGDNPVALAALFAYGRARIDSAR